MLSHHSTRPMAPYTLIITCLVAFSGLAIAFISPLPNSFRYPVRPCSYVNKGFHSISFNKKHQLDENVITSKPADPQERFKRVASSEMASVTPCILTIDGRQYNMTSWVNAHPGGSSVLKRLHDKNATHAFFAAGHSQQAIDMLQEFLIHDDNNVSEKDPTRITAIGSPTVNSMETLARIRAKLFTKEDPLGIHKYCGIFVLVHFIFRFLQSYFGDPSAGFGGCMGRGSSVQTLACIIPHTILSLSSLIFHTVPRERIVGRPMIWQEFRAHNILFAMRSIACTTLAWFAVYKPKWRKLCVTGSATCVLTTLFIANYVTRVFRNDIRESTTATMPYWEGCSLETQQRFKSFYAFSQFMATIACLVTLNPAWPFLVLLPIQLASLLMTLVRKGLLTSKGYHIGYTISLCLPYFSVLRSFLCSRTMDVPALTLLAYILFQMRRRGINKYVLWGSTALVRISVGDKLLDWKFLTQ